MLKTGTKAMLTVNTDIPDRRIRGQGENIRHIEFAQGLVCKVYAKFSDEQAGSIAMKSSYLGRKISWVSIERCENEISMKKGSA